MTSLKDLSSSIKPDFTLLAAHKCYVDTDKTSNDTLVHNKLINSPFLNRAFTGKLTFTFHYFCVDNKINIYLKSINQYLSIILNKAIKSFFKNRIASALESQLIFSKPIPTFFPAVTLNDNFSPLIFCVSLLHPFYTSRE